MKKNKLLNLIALVVMALCFSTFTLAETNKVAADNDNSINIIQTQNASPVLTAQAANEFPVYASPSSEAARTIETFDNRTTRRQIETASAISFAPPNTRHGADAVSNKPDKGFLKQTFDAGNSLIKRE